MAQLPAVGPEAFSFRLPIARVPKDPVPQAAANVAISGEEAVSRVATALINHRKMLQDHKGLIEARAQVARLESTIDETVDLDKKYELMQTGFNDIPSKVQEAYPGMSEEMKDRISALMDDKQEMMRKSLIVKMEKMQRNDLKATINLVRQSAKFANNPEDRQNIVKHGFEIIEDSVLLSPTEKQWLKVKLKHDVDLDYGEALVNSPKGHMIDSFTAEQLGLTTNEYNKLVDKANKKHDDEDDAGARAYKKMRSDALTEVMTTNPTPQRLEELKYFIPGPLYHSLKSKQPDESGILFNQLKDTMEHGRFENKEQLDTWVLDNIAMNTELSTKQKSLLSKVHSVVKERMANIQGQRAYDSTHDLEDYIEEVGGWAYRNMPGDPTTRRLNNVLKHYASDVHHVKDLDGISKLSERAYKKIEEIKGKRDHPNLPKNLSKGNANKVKNIKEENIP